MGYLREFTNMIGGLRYEDIPAGIAAKAKDSLADYLAVFSAGCAFTDSKRLLKALGGDAGGLSPDNLALWTGATGRLMDLDDGHQRAFGHPGVPICASVLGALGAAGRPVEGTRVTLALVAGYEMYAYLGRSINPSAFLERGFDGTAICGAVGGAVAAALILDADCGELFGAASLAASLCGGLNQYYEDGSSPKYLGAGFAARLAVIAAQMAKYGLYGPENILEGKFGFLHCFSPDPDGGSLADPSMKWEVGETYLKKYACVRRMHAALDLVDDIMAREGLTADDICTVTVSGGKLLCKAGIYEPKELVQAQLSIPYAMALLIRDRAVTAEGIETNLDDSGIAALSHRISLKLDPELEALAEREPGLWGAAKVEIVCADGRRFSDESIVAKGCSEKPFSQDEVRKKYMTLTMTGLRKDVAEQVWEAIRQLESLLDTKAALFPAVTGH